MESFRKPLDWDLEKNLEKMSGPSLRALLEALEFTAEEGARIIAFIRDRDGDAYRFDSLSLKVKAECIGIAANRLGIPLRF
jgi:hypothetical protein